MRSKRLGHRSRGVTGRRGGAQAPPTTEEIDDITAERVELYRCRKPEGPKFPLLVQKSDIKDRIPTEAEVAEAVQGLKGVRAGGSS